MYIKNNYIVGILHIEIQKHENQFGTNSDIKYCQLGGVHAGKNDGDVKQ